MRSPCNRARYRRKSRVEIIPLIDVMFLLLCFFIYAAMNIVTQKAITVDLAGADSGTMRERTPREVILSVDRGGNYFINKNPVTRESLEDTLTSMNLSRDSYAVVINADKEVPHGKVIELLNTVRRHGIQETLFAVGPRPAPQAKETDF